MTVCDHCACVRPDDVVNCPTRRCTERRLFPEIVEQQDQREAELIAEIERMIERRDHHLASMELLLHVRSTDLDVQQAVAHVTVARYYSDEIEKLVATL